MAQLMTLYIPRRRVLVFSFIAAANGCAKSTTIGVSGGRSIDPRPASPTVIVAAHDESLHAYLPSVGDIDGDGHGDFMLDAIGKEHFNQRQPIENGCLFYGRSRFPAQLSSADADAVFVSGASMEHALGDVNGDGFDDMMFGDPLRAEIVFGSAKRYSGTHPEFSTGVQWQYAPHAGSTPLQSTSIQLGRLGDVNGDGKDEFLVRVEEPQVDGMNGHASILTDYMVAGQSEAWPSGVWDPKWAAAKFGDELIPDPAATVVSHLTFVSSGDLDGDGYTDFVAQGFQDSLWLFYGRPEGFHGALASHDADAQIVGGDNAWFSAVFVGDIDGDGADDLITNNVDELTITYGSHTRWSGVVTPPADLTFFGQWPYSTPIVGDFDADGFVDLIVSATQVLPRRLVDGRASHDRDGHRA